MIEMRWIKIPHGGDTKNALSISPMGLFPSENFQLQYRERTFVEEMDANGRGATSHPFWPAWTDVKIESP